VVSILQITEVLKPLLTIIIIEHPKFYPMCTPAGSGMSNANPEKPAKLPQKPCAKPFIINFIRLIPSAVVIPYYYVLLDFPNNFLL
jgi:hypothetical protein